MKNEILVFLEEVAMNEKHIHVKELSNGLSSYNFSRKVFYEQVWNELTTKARGLFLNKKDLVVVARSYDKFFDIKESEIDSLKYPVNVYVKYNGFLGILGYNHETDDLEFCSKSTNTGDFAGYFKKLFELNYQSSYSMVKDYLKENKKTMVFEVVDNENDRHIVSYNENRLVLLDVIDNTLTFSSLSYEDAGRIAKSFGMEFKEKAHVFNDKEEFYPFYLESIKEGYKYNGDYLEGFILEDSSGYMTKIKCHYYNFWKKLRGLVQKVKNKKIDFKMVDPQYVEVLDFIVKNELEDHHIIDIREKYLKKF